ncbi:microtubule integrity protein mal3-like [Castanea sativa]|uniref:microtubule integrity protein mal3-like n=1 Tax=Castanea sativa TaxID=21020 RepID=UPI003F64CDCD
MNVVNYAPKELPELRCGGIRMNQAASGAVQCQMMDMTYPGVVPMHKVNFDANSEYDMIVEYKVLQEVFNKFYFDKNFLPQPPGWSVEALDQDLEQICWKEHLGSKHQELFCLNKKEPLLSS